MCRAAAVSVPATSANLGPGFDCLGLALELRDTYTVRVRDGAGVRVRSEGQDAAGLPADETHLVASSLLTALDRLAVEPVGLDLACRNSIPQSRGLGSSAAAIVGGVALAFALAGGIEGRLGEILDLAAQIEGHPDNVAPAVLGGFTISWTDDAGRSHAVRLPVADELAAVVFVPEATSPTHEARAVLPESVPMSAAVHNAARSALLVAALSGRTDLIFPATADRLHQEQRRNTYPATMELVDRLRADGAAAVVSGAGPAVLVLTTGNDAPEVADTVGAGFSSRVLGVSAGIELHSGARVDDMPDGDRS